MKVAAVLLVLALASLTLSAVVWLRFVSNLWTQECGELAAARISDHPGTAKATHAELRLPPISGQHLSRESRTVSSFHVVP